MLFIGAFYWVHLLSITPFGQEYGNIWSYARSKRVFKVHLMACNIRKFNIRTPVVNSLQ